MTLFDLICCENINIIFDNVQVDDFEKSYNICSCDTSKNLSIKILNSSQFEKCLHILKDDGKMNYVPISRPYAESVNNKFWIKYELNNNELIPLCTEFLERCCRNIETIKNSKSFGNKR